LLKNEVKMCVCGIFMTLVQLVDGDHKHLSS